jgi:hypothetical protein
MVRAHAGLLPGFRSLLALVLVLAAALVTVSFAAWGQAPTGAARKPPAKASSAAANAAKTKVAPQTPREANLARLKAHAQSSVANFAPVGDGLTFADPFFGGTTDSVIIESLSPLEAQAPLLRRLADCSLEAGIGSSSTFQVGQRIEKYEDRLHQVALLNTAVDVYPHGCTDPITGVASQPGAVFGTDSGGNFYAVVAFPDLTTFELTNQLTLVHTQGNPISSQPAQTSLITLNPNSAVTVEGDIAVGDLNGDNQLDVVVPLIDLSNGTGGTSTNNSLAILLNAGSGALGTPTYLPLNIFPTSVVIDDINKDGFLDIIVLGTPASAGGMQGMEVFLGKGNGTFNSPIEGPTGFPSINASSFLPLNSVVHAITGDFNGDGKKDLIASTGDILFGKGDGTFTVAPTTLAVPGNAGLGITSADFNHDGKVDLAVAVHPGTINIFYGNGEGSFSPGNVYSAPSGTADLTATDIDGDGNYDVVLGVSSGGLYLPDGLATLSGYFLLGRSDGTFAGPLSYQPTAAQTANQITQVPSLGIFAGDVTGKGNIDLVSWDQTALSGSFPVTLPYSGISDGDVKYGAPIVSALNAYPVSGSMNLLDVNGDNKLDLVYVTGDDPGAIATLPGNGDGTFGAEIDSSLSTGFGIGDNLLHAMVVANFNADTKPDVVLFVQDNGDNNSTLEFAAGSGNGQFATPVAIDATLVTPMDIVAADVNGDGKMDLVVADAGPYNSNFQNPNPVVKVYIGKGDGTFAAPLVLTFDATSMGLDGTMALSVADLRGDNKLDIIAQSTEPGTDMAFGGVLDQGIYQVFLGNGDGTFQKQTVQTPEASLGSSVVTGDFNRDGKIDLLLSCGFDLCYFTGNGDGTLSAPNVLTVPGAPYELAVADLNGDGHLDLATMGEGVVVAVNVVAVPLLGNTVSTTTALTASATQAAPGASITFTATVTPAFGTAVPTGTIGFFDGGTELGTGTLNGSGIATYTTTSLALGAHSIVATYNGDATFTISTSDTLTITIANSSVPVAGVSPTTLMFVSQALNTSSAAQAITLSNTGGAALTVSGITIGGTNAGDFSQTNTCGSSVAASASCTISVTFKPTASGTRSASVSIADNATGSPQSVTLSGTGAAAGTPTATLAPTALTFASQALNTASAAQSITLSNSSATALTISGVTITGADLGDFSQTNTCGTSVPASKTCAISVTFKPTASGTRTASISVADNANGSPQTAALSGTGASSTPTASLAPASLTFASQSLNTASSVQTITLSNTSAAALTITGVTITGANAGDFSQTNTCGTSVAASGTCAISVTFKPTASGGRTASISVADNATGSPQTATLSGTGAASGTPTATLSPTSLTFPDGVITTSSTAQIIKLSNTSNTTLTVSGITFTGANAADFTETDNCGTSVAASANCTINVVFKAGASGARAAAISIADNATGSPQTANLSGNGLDLSPSAAASGSTTATVTTGSTANYALQVTGVGGGAADKISYTVTCSGAPANATCIAPTTSMTVSPGTPSTFTVSVSTGPATMAALRDTSSANPPSRSLRSLFAVALLFFAIVAMLISRKPQAAQISASSRARPIALRHAGSLALLVLVAFLVVSCSGSGTPSQDVAPGTYQLTVTVASGTDTHTLPLTLIVTK